MQKNLLFSLFYLVPSLFGFFIIIFAKQIKIFINKLDPLKIDYEENWFRGIGVALITTSILFALNFLNK